MCVCGLRARTVYHKLYTVTVKRVACLKHWGSCKGRQYQYSPLVACMYTFEPSVDGDSLRWAGLIHDSLDAAIMAAAKPIELFELLRQAISSTEDGNVYLCAACIVLQKESSVERAYESLLASVLQLLERQSAASSTCTCEICGVGMGDGGGVSGGEGEGEGVRGRRVWQLCREAAKFGVRNSKPLLGFLCSCHHFQDCCCQLVLAALTLGCSCGFLQGGKNLSHFLTHVYMHFWSSQIEQFAKIANSINLSIESSATDVWFICIKHAALLHVLQQMHSVLKSTLGQYMCTGSTRQTGLSNETDTSMATTCKQFLCEETSNPLAVRLAHALPRVLHSMYQKWWRSDEEILKNQKEVPAVNEEGVGLVLKVCIL